MKKALTAAGVLAVSLFAFIPAWVLPAAADPIDEGTAYAYGGNVELAGQPVLIAEDASALAQAPPFPADVDDPSQAFLPLDLQTLAVSLTLAAFANVHQNADLATVLESDSAQQPIAGPYNMRAIGQTEQLSVLLQPPLGLPLDPVALVEADAVRAEAAAVCRAGQMQYTASSEYVNLEVGGTPLLGDINGPVSELLGTVGDLLDALGLSGAVLDIDTNVVTPQADGIAVDALVITVLPALGSAPLLELTIGHAEVSGGSCADIPECSDGQDNDGDGLIDADDPGCRNPDGTYDPNDDDERNECTDTIDNADPEDTLADQNDPGCYTNGVYDPQDDDERDEGGTLARTGSNSAAPLIGGGALVTAALGFLLLRRRTVA